MMVRNQKTIEHSFLLFIIILPLLNMLFPHLLWEHQLLISYPVHSAMEAIGAIAAIFMGFLSARWLSGSDAPRYIFVSLGFLSMGIFDLFHSIVLQGNGFVLLHSLALLSGGAMFALFSLPVSSKILNYNTLIKVATALFVSVIGGIIIMNRSLLPEMIINGEFTTSAKLMNLVAGLLFLSAAIRMYMDYRREGGKRLLLLTGVALLSASAGLIFPFSEAWCDGWWFWHGLRLTAFLLVLIFIISNFGKTLRDNRTTLSMLEAKQLEFHEILTKLKKSEEQFDLAMQGANDGLWDWDLVTNAVYFSPRWKTMLGYTDDELENSFETWECLVHPDDIHAAKDAIESYIAGKKKNYQIEFRMKNKQGHDVNILSRGFAVRDDSSGTPLRLIGTHADITEQKQAQAELISERQFSDTLIDSLPGVFYMFNQQGRFVRWNKNFESVTGYSHDEIAKMTPLELFTGEDQQHVAERIGRVFTDGQADVEAAFTTKNGQQIPYLLTGIMIEIEKKPYLAGVGIDITDRKQAEELLSQQSEELKKNNAELKTFNKMAVGREMRMIELKEKINQLSKELGKETLYDTSFAENR